MVQYKLTFFDARANTETIRLMLHYANVPFEDNRITQEEWADIKPTTPFGQLPVLEIDGFKLAQTHAIARYLARKHGLAGKNDLDEAQIDSYSEILVDFYRKGSSFIMFLRGYVDGDKEILHEDFREAVEQYLTVIEKILEKSSSGFFSNTGISWVDFALANITILMEELVPKDIERFIAIKAHSKRVHELPQLQAYLDSRKKSI